MIPEKLQNWVNEMRSKGMSEAALTALETEWGAKKDVADEFARTVLAVPDYSRQTQDLKKRNDELTQKETDLQNYLAELNQWKTDRELDLRKKSEEATAFKAQRDQIKTQLDQIAAEQKNLYEQGLTTMNPDSIINNNQQTTANMNTQTPQNYLTQEQLSEALNNQAQEAVRLQALQGSIIRDHFKLFGDIPDTETLINKAIKTHKPLKEVWESEYKVNEKRQSLEEEAINKRIEEEVAKRVSAAQSDAAIKGNSFRQGDTSPVLNVLLRKQGESTPLANPSNSDARSSALGEALAAYREGKFRPNNV